MVRWTLVQTHTETTVYGEGSCISTDEKPESIAGKDIITGAMLLEVDTGDIYAYNEEAASGSRWGVIASLGGGS